MFKKDSGRSKASWTNSEVIFDLAGKHSHLEKLETAMAAPGFWDDTENARTTVEEARQLKRWTHAKKQALIDGDQARLKQLSKRCCS